MPKGTVKRSSTRKRSHTRRRTLHLFETPEFKAELKRSINDNLYKVSQGGFGFPTNIPLEQLLAPCKKTRGKKGRITRPQNAFILYRKDLQEKIKFENPGADFKEISRIAGNKWKNESDQIKNNYTLLASLGGLVHQELFPHYRYQPRQKDNVERKNKEIVGEEEIDDVDDEGEESEREEVEKEETVVLEEEERPIKPWVSIPQIFNNNSPEFPEFRENVLTSPHNILLQKAMQVDLNLVESPYYNNPINQTLMKIEPPDNELKLNYFDQIDENLINNLSNDMLNSFNNNINSPENNSSNEEMNNLLIFPTVNSFEIESEPVPQSSSYVPVTNQVNTTVPSFYSSIVDNIPVYSDQIAPIITATPYTAIVSTPNLTFDDSYDMEFLNEWGNKELLDNLYH